MNIKVSSNGGATYIISKIRAKQQVLDPVRLSPLPRGSLVRSNDFTYLIYTNQAKILVTMARSLKNVHKLLITLL